LNLRVISPLGSIIQGGSPGVEQSTGRTWTFLRFALPHNGESDGGWSIEVFRAAGASDVAARSVDVHYFVNVIVDGGPRLELMPSRRRYYTGDTINPLIALRYRDGTHPHHAKVELEVSRPEASIGNILTKSGLRQPLTLDADTIPARQATLLALEAESGKPAVTHTQQTFQLFEDPAHTDGLFEASGIFGHRLTDLLNAEGNYMFRFKATYGEDCTATRELFWTLHIDSGIDPSRTDFKTSVISANPDGTRVVKINIIPRDKYGNHLGPGRIDALSINGVLGTTPTEQPQDNRDGSYSIIAIWDSSVSPSPGIVIAQPDRPTVIVQDPAGGQKWTTWCWMLLILVIILLLIIILILLS
jgi:hypothetical protein